MYKWGGRMANRARKIPVVEIEERESKRHLLIRLSLPEKRHRREALQRWMVRAMAILSAAIGLMSVAVVGLVLLVTFLSRPEVGQILITLLRLLSRIAG